MGKRTRGDVIQTANCKFGRFPGFLRTEYMFVGEKSDMDLDNEDGLFMLSCQAAEIEKLTYKRAMLSEDEGRYAIFFVECWRWEREKIESALDTFGRKMEFKYSGYKNFVDKLFNSLAVEG